MAVWGQYMGLQVQYGAVHPPLPPPLSLAPRTPPLHAHTPRYQPSLQCRPCRLCVVGVGAAPMAVIAHCHHLSARARLHLMSAMHPCPWYGSHPAPHQPLGAVPGRGRAARRLGRRREGCSCKAHVVSGAASSEGALAGWRCMLMWAMGGRLH